MIALKTRIEVEAVMPGGKEFDRHYGECDVHRMCRQLFRLAGWEEDESHRAFYQGFAACLDVLASGQLSPVYVQGSAVRALADVAEPHGMPGEITDVGRYAAEERSWR